MRDQQNAKHNTETDSLTQMPVPVDDDSYEPLQQVEVEMVPIEEDLPCDDSDDSQQEQRGRVCFGPLF